MKKIFKKNQVIIAALSIMIVIAGYLNFTSDKEILSTTGETEQASENNTQDDSLISAAVNDNVITESAVDDYAFADSTDTTSSDDNNEVEENIPEINQDNQENADVAQASLDENGDPINAETVGEAVLTNGAVTISEAKINREQVRAKSKEMLLEIINNEKLAEESKKEAIDKMLAITENMEKENAAEVQLAAKGFQDSIVSISEDCVDVTLNCSELNSKQRTQIEDIIKRKTGFDVNKIVITTATAQEF